MLQKSRCAKWLRKITIIFICFSRNLTNANVSDRLHCDVTNRRRATTVVCSKRAFRSGQLRKRQRTHRSRSPMKTTHMSPEKAEDRSDGLVAVKWPTAICIKETQSFFFQSNRGSSSKGDITWHSFNRGRVGDRFVQDIHDMCRKKRPHDVEITAKIACRVQKLVISFPWNQGYFATRLAEISFRHFRWSNFLSD